MNFTAFNLDVDSAKKADSDGGSRINRTDKYVGRIVRLEFIVSQKGTQGVEVVFESDDKSEATLTIWTFSADGTPIFGRDKVNALMACTQTRTLTPTQAKVEKYDFDTKQKIVQTVTVAPELENKRVGLLIQMEEYLNGAGEIKSKPAYVSAFQVDTNLMAKEILERKTSPDALDKAYARLIKNGDKRISLEKAQQGYAMGKAQADDSDDLPF